MADMVHHPAHYNSHPAGIEAIDVVEAFSFNVGTAVKHLWRAGLKDPNPLQDLLKAHFYIVREIGLVQRGLVEAELSEELRQALAGFEAAAQAQRQAAGAKADAAAEERLDAAMEDPRDEHGHKRHLFGS
jgi:uncharacterized protein DUF3310